MSRTPCHRESLMEAIGERGCRHDTYNPIRPGVSLIHWSVTTQRAAKELWARTYGLTREDHWALAYDFGAASLRWHQVSNDLADIACWQTFDRPLAVTDYRISGIWREELPESFKEAMRAAIGRENLCRALSNLHERVALNFGRYR